MQAIEGSKRQSKLSNFEETSSFSSSANENIQYEYHKIPDIIMTECSLSSTSQMRVKKTSLAQACDRKEVSGRSTAILMSAALKDMEILTKEN